MTSAQAVIAPPDPEPISQDPAFTLVEVIVAIGMVAVTVVALVALLAASSRAAGEMAARQQAVHLADAVTLELLRLRDALPGDEPAGGLDVLATLIPESASSQSLRLVGSLDGLRIVRESEAGDPELGLAPGDRYFLIEVRQQSGNLAYVAGAGFLAVSAKVRWPYQSKLGPEGSAAVTADLSQASTAVLNLAVTP